MNLFEEKDSKALKKERLMKAGYPVGETNFVSNKRSYGSLGVGNATFKT